MYGLVNQAMKDLVVTKFGEEKWISTCNDAKSPTQDFVNMQYYPDELTYSLVGAASKNLGLAAEDILVEFGKYWVLYTAKTGYGPLMDLFGHDFKSCLMGLNNLHARMGLSMPSLTPPQFNFSELNPHLFHVEYISKRAGLEPFVKGLFIGLATKFGTVIDVQLSQVESRKIFRIEVRG